MTPSKKIPIHVDLSVSIVKHGYDYIGKKDLGDVIGNCDECGHPLRYEYRVKDHHDKKTYVLGSECIYKLVALENWESQIDYVDLKKKQLLRAGKWRWILSRDGLLRFVDKIPEPKNYPKDYKDFADAMKDTVFAARRKLKAEKKKQQQKARREEDAKLRRKRLESSKEEWGKFLKDNNIDPILITSREKDFLISVWKRLRYGRTLSPKQQKWFDDIKKKKKVGTKPKETSSFSKMPFSAFGVLTEWEKKFVRDIKVKMERGDHLTEKQINQANKILAKMKSGKPDTKTTVSGSYIGKRAKPWIMKQKTGTMKYGNITNVHRETEKAVLCDVELGGTTYLNKWLPKSQITS